MRLIKIDNNNLLVEIASKTNLHRNYFAITKGPNLINIIKLCGRYENFA